MGILSAWYLIVWQHVDWRAAEANCELDKKTTCGSTRVNHLSPDPYTNHQPSCRTVHVARIDLVALATMASSPLFRSALAKERYRSTQSVPAQSPNDDRYSTPSIGRSAHGFYNRSVTPSSRLRILPPSFDQPEERRALVSDYRLLKAWDEVESRYSHVGLEDDDEIDLATETVHRPDGSTTKLLSHDRRKRRKRRSFGDESKGGRTNEKDGSGDDDDEDSYSEERSDEEEGSSGADSQSIGEGTDDDDEDGMESWTAQEDSLLAQQEEKEAAVMLTKLREGPAIDPEEELAEFHRHEEVLRQRRMSARAEGRDSRCHTDALSGSDDEPKRPMSRSPSRFSTIVAESEHDLFPDMDSSEDEIAVASSDADLDRVSRYPSISSEEVSLLRFIMSRDVD
jgi:hypothetical protein